MSRTYGARDLRKRKKRSDAGKSRKTYAGKSVKKKRRYKGFVRYVSERRRDAPIKLWAWEERPMNKDSYRNFSAKTRPFMRKIVYKPTLRIDVDPYSISTKELVEKLCLDHLWDGTWLLFGFSHGKNKYRVKPVKLCKVRITDHPDGLRARMTRNFRLYRYFFWQGK